MADRRLGDGFRRPERPRGQPDVASPEPVATPPVPTPAAKRATAKFTVLLSPEDAATFDELSLTLRRLLGHRVPKADIVRALVMLAADDATLREQLARELSGDGSTA